MEVGRSSKTGMKVRIKPDREADAFGKMEDPMERDKGRDGWEGNAGGWKGKKRLPGG